MDNFSDTLLVKAKSATYEAKLQNVSSANTWTLCYCQLSKTDKLKPLCQVEEKWKSKFQDAKYESL